MPHECMMLHRKINEPFNGKYKYCRQAAQLLSVSLQRLQVQIWLMLTFFIVQIEYDVSCYSDFVENILVFVANVGLIVSLAILLFSVLINPWC